MCIRDRLTAHPPVNPLLKLIVLPDGTPPQATVMSASAVIVGSAAGLTVIVLDTDASGLPQTSVAVHVSVTVPPHASGVAVNVEVADVPLISQPPLNPLLNDMVLVAGTPPQATAMSAGAVIVGSNAGATVIILDTDAITLLHSSVAVHVSVTGPPHAPGIVENVEVADVPLIKQLPLNPLLNDMVLVAGTPPQATAMSAGAVIVGSNAGATVIILDTDAITLLHSSVAVHVSVTGPPHAPGIVENVEVADVPLIKQSPLNPLLNDMVLVAGTPPQATAMSAGAVIVGSNAGATVIILDTDAITLLHSSVAVLVF